MKELTDSIESNQSAMIEEERETYV